MSFSLEFDKHSREEIGLVKKLAKEYPEELDSRELWILKNSFEGDEDD